MLAYDVYGQGEPLLLLHAGGMSAGEWAAHVEALSARFQVITPDLPGHGRSLLGQGETLTVSGAAEAVLALLDHLGLPSANWLGSSMGGAVSLWAALTAPERVRRLVLYRVSYRSDPDAHAEVARMAQPDTWRQWGMGRWMSTQHAAQGGPDAWEQVPARVASAFDPATTDHAHDLGDLSTIRVPTLVAAGDRDPIVSVEAAVAMYRAIPHAQLWIMPNAAHFVGADTWRKAIFQTEILRFLEA